MVPSAISSAVETLARANLNYLYAHPDTPPLARSGIRYQREPVGIREKWQTIPEVLERGNGDCEDLAAWRIAELRRAGYRAEPYVTRQRDTFHIRVRAIIGNEQVILDPSKELGMPT